MLGRRGREASPRASTGAGGFAAKADDLESLRGAVVDAASVGTGLWLSYLFALFYFAVAAGAVTHRMLLLEEPVKLPFLNVELPLTAFFILGPAVFIIVHGYVLLHFVLLAGKVGAFNAVLSQQIADKNRRTRLRRQLPSNVFVQFLAGPRDVRYGIVGLLLKAVAWIGLVFAPIGLLVLFQLQFLPYHDPVVTWWHRIAVVIDLALLWLLWPPILRGETRLIGWRDFGRGWVLTSLAASLLPLFLAFIVATFPGEWAPGDWGRDHLRSAAWVPTKSPWPKAPAKSDQAVAAAVPEDNQAKPAGNAAAKPLPQAPTFWQSATQAWSSMGWTSPYQLLVAGEPDQVRQRPGSVWSNVLVLPNFDPSDPPKKLSFRGRRLEQAIFVAANLKKADFTGAELPGADLTRADLSQAKFDCDQEAKSKPKCSNLQGALLDAAQLQGASLDAAQLQGASLDAALLPGASLRGARLQGARLDRAEMQGASLDGAQLQGASLQHAQLQGVSLDSKPQVGAQLHGASLLEQLQSASPVDVGLQGASLREAQLQGASLREAQLQGGYLAKVFVWQVDPPALESVEGALIRSPIPETKYSGEYLYFSEGCTECDWKKKYYDTLKEKIEAVPPGPGREAALKRIKPLGEEPFTVDEKAAKGWQDLARKSEALEASYPARLAEALIKTGCEEAGAPYVIRGLKAQLDGRFEPGDLQKAKVAKAFLDEPNCPGARGLSDDDKRELRRLARAGPK